MKIRSLLSVLSLVTVMQLSGSAWAAGDCGNWVDGAGTSNQSIGCTGEDTGYSSSGFYGDCYGACGYGCSWDNCGSGGAWPDPRLRTRTYGLWSGQALSVFPKAIVQWGSCIAGKGINYVGASIHSKSTGSNGSSSDRTNG